MIGLVALDFILGFGRAGVMDVTLVIHITGVDHDDRAADVSGFGIPREVIAHPEVVVHLSSTPPFAGDHDSNVLHGASLGAHSLTPSIIRD